VQTDQGKTQPCCVTVSRLGTCDVVILFTNAFLFCPTRHVAWIYAICVSFRCTFLTIWQVNSVLCCVFVRPV